MQINATLQAQRNSGGVCEKVRAFTYVFVWGLVWGWEGWRCVRSRWCAGLLLDELEKWGRKLLLRKPADHLVSRYQQQFILEQGKIFLFFTYSSSFPFCISEDGSHNSSIETGLKAYLCSIPPPHTLLISQTGIKLCFRDWSYVSIMDHRTGRVQWAPFLF